MAKKDNGDMSYETKTIIVILLLLFILPAGLVLMWVWMKWPTWLKILITVLPFLFAFLIAAFVGWILVTIFSNPNVQKQMQNITSVKVSQSPKEVTQEFYDDYLHCLNNHFENPKGQSPRQECPYESYTVLTPQLMKQLDQRKGGDPILCAQNTPTSILAKEELVTNNQAEVITHHFYKSSGDNQVKVLLNKTPKGWEINNIICRQKPY